MTNIKATQVLILRFEIQTLGQRNNRHKNGMLIETEYFKIEKILSISCKRI